MVWKSLFLNVIIKKKFGNYVGGNLRDVDVYDSDYPLADGVESLRLGGNKDTPIWTLTRPDHQEQLDELLKFISEAVPSLISKSL